LHTVVLIITILILLAGLLVTLFPVIPSIPLIFLTMLVYGMIEGFKHVTTGFLIAMLILTVGSFLIDNLAGWYGSKKYGASTSGAVGALIGGLLGVFISPEIGIFIGPVIGTITVELIFNRRTFQEACRMGLGTLLGLLSGSIARFIIALAMVIAFMIKVL
jgi:uncharacterized protein YqgC (DUF456 family)